jgi:hypothetical protein
MLVTQSGSGNKSHLLDFLGDFRSCPLAEIVLDNTLQTWHPTSLYSSSNDKITPDVLRATLNNLFKNYWYLGIKKHVLMTRQSEWIANRSGFIRARKKEVGRRWGTGNTSEDKLRARAGSGQMVLGPAKILKFRPVNTASLQTLFGSPMYSCDIQKTDCIMCSHFDHFVTEQHDVC